VQNIDSMAEELTYRSSGVDIDEGERFVKLIAPLVKRTFRREVLTGLGQFGSLFELDVARYKKPVLVSGTDGVGTKLKMAFLCNKHDTVGIDLVAMCVNDIITSGAEPLFFLDYFATGKLRSEQAKNIIEGIVKGCTEAGCSLVGGETAEMPGFYGKDEYDLSGCAVGVVDKDEIVDGRNVKEGDVIIGIASSGLHSNGYSLARRLFFELKQFNPDTYMDELARPLGEELLEPTRIYVKAVNALAEGSFKTKAMAHITGGGIPGNLPRVLPEGATAIIRDGSWPESPIFKQIRAEGHISDREMKKTFNLGIGYCIIISSHEAQEAVTHLSHSGHESYIIGEIRKGVKGVEYV
jgi:phosphoribosylformylglycinamidine cyclo-ligase